MIKPKHLAVILCGLLAIASARPAIAQAYYVATYGSDGNPGTLAQPFATIAMAQRAMHNSGIKTTYIRSGTYAVSPTAAGCYGSVAILLGPADSGETFAFYPADGVDTATLDGGSRVDLAFCFYGATNVTINGLQAQNFNYAILLIAGDQWLSSTGNIIENNIFHDIGNSGSVIVGEFGRVQNNQIINNYIYNSPNFGIGAWTDNNGNISNLYIANNYVYHTCTLSPDCGAIYLWDPMASSTNITINNNYIRDVYVYGAGGRGIYDDDGTSNTTMVGNIITGSHFACFQIHGGSNNWMVGNVCDEENGPYQDIVFYQQDPPGGTQTSMTGNTFTKNIVVAGSYGGGSGFVGNSSPPNPMAISSNFYFNYVGPGLSSQGIGGAGSDPNPSYGNPLVTCWNYYIEPYSPVFSSISFPGIAGGWGPPGFVIPQIGTPQSGC
jgi:hypothetical protein